MGDVYLNWPNWLHFLIFEGGLLVILIDCMMADCMMPCSVCLLALDGVNESQLTHTKKNEQTEICKLVSQGGFFRVNQGCYFVVCLH